MNLTNNLSRNRIFQRELPQPKVSESEELLAARPDRGYDRIGRRTTMLKPGSPGGA
jgi:hypothetical protein